MRKNSKEIDRELRQSARNAKIETIKDFIISKDKVAHQELAELTDCS